MYSFTNYVLKMQIEGVPEVHITASLKVTFATERSQTEC